MNNNLDSNSDLLLNNNLNSGSEGLKALGKIEQDQDYSHSGQSAPSVLPSDNGLYVLNLKYKWEVGAIIYYDGRVNYQGRVAVKAKHRTTYRFDGNASINAQNLDRGDLVVFTTKNGEIEDLYALRYVANFPWSMVFKHVDFYRDIEFDYYLDREKTMSLHLAIPVIEKCLRMHKEADEDNLWKAFYKRMQSYETTDLKDKYLQEVLPYGIRDLFVNKCVKSEYFTRLQDENERLVNQYVYLVTKILSSSINDGDLKVATQILNCFKLESAFNSFIEAFNYLDDDWGKQKEVILSSQVPDGTDDCFAEILMSETETVFSSRSLIALATLKENDFYLEYLAEDYGDDIQSWLETVPYDDFSALSLYLNRFDTILTDSYIQVLKDRDDSLKILLAEIHDGEECTLERILKTVESNNEVSNISSLLLLLPPSAMDYLFRSYSLYPEGNKKRISVQP